MQQINLYQEQFKKRKVPLSGVSLCLILIISVAALTVVQLFSQQALGPLEAEQAEMSLQMEDLTARVAVAEQAARPRPADKQLASEVEGLVRRLQHNQRLLQALTEGAMSNTRGFSGYFEAVANRHVNGTWITRLQIAGGGQQFGFSGKSVQPELVPAYLENLADDQVFDDFSFNVLEIERNEKDVPVIDFNISTGNG